MAIPKKTSQDFATDLESAILSRNAQYDTKIGPIPDLMINPAAGVLEVQNDRIRSVEQLLSLNNLAAFSNSDVDNFVYNELLIRATGTRSRVNLVFSRAAPPTSNITVAANFPVATLADEETGVSVTFITTEPATMYSATPGAYLNTTTQRYELTIPARSVTGTAYSNVSAYRINKPLRALNGFDSVTNTSPATGGSDVETNEELAHRYMLSLIGSSPAVVRGIEKILRDLFPETIDSNVVFGNNPDNVRSATDGGAVDVFVIGSTPTSITESYVYTGPDQVIPLLTQPVVEILSIGAYAQDTDFELVKDTTGNAESVRAQDGFRFNTTTATSLPAIGDILSVTYAYDLMQPTLQAAFTADDYNVTGRDLLFKRAEQIDLTITATIKIRSGFNVSQMVALATSAVLNLINDKTLGESVEVSDIQAAVRAYSAVDNFIISNVSIVGSTGTSDIILTANQFARIAVADISITAI